MKFNLINKYIAITGARNDIGRTSVASSTKGVPIQIIGRVAKPEEISDLITFLSSDRSSFVTRLIYNIDGSMSL